MQLAALASHPAAVRAIGALLVVASIFGAGWWAGSGHVRLQELERAAADERAASERYRQAVAAGEARASALLAQLRGMNDHANSLQERLDTDVRNHVPLVVARPARCGGGAAVLRAVDSVAPGTPVPADVSLQPADDGVRLTLGAVSVWNSALAGVGLSAGACGADGTPGAACAADAGLELVDAWRNHVTNAASCAADRARLGALIDHLKAQGR